MGAFGVLLLLVPILAVIAWLVAEFRSKTSLRVASGVVAILAVAVCTSVTGYSLAMFGRELDKVLPFAYMAGPSMSLWNEVLKGLEHGKQDAVVASLKKLDRDMGNDLSNVTPEQFMDRLFQAQVEIESTPSPDDH